MLFAAKDSTEVDPTGHRVVFENDYIRVVEARLVSGCRVALHSHPPRLIVALSNYQLKLTAPDGASKVVERRTGDVLWSESEEHSVEVLARPVHSIEVEVKAA